MIVATGYLLLALFLAVTLNAANRFIRAMGTLVAALSLASMVSSILLADFDGTFAMRAQALLHDWVKPAILNVGCRATSLMAGQRHDRMAGLGDRRLGVARP